VALRSGGDSVEHVSSDDVCSARVGFGPIDATPRLRRHVPTNKQRRRRAGDRGWSASDIRRRSRIVSIELPVVWIGEGWCR
jgi:hypothetical protein